MPELRHGPEKFDADFFQQSKTKKVRCSKCNGTGRIPKYKHIDDGKCFACNGTRWVTLTIEPPPAFLAVPLFVTLQQVKDEWPQHDSFGDLKSSFSANFEKLLRAVGRRDDMAASVSIGDVARAFDLGMGRTLALKIPGVDLRTITRMILPAAERAAATVKEPSLLHAVARARKIIDTDEEVEPLYRPPIRHFASHHDTPESHAKACGEALTMIARRGVVVGDPNPYMFECHWVLGHASSALQGMERRQSRVPSEVARLEGERRMEDMYAVTPLHVFAGEVDESAA